MNQLARNNYNHLIFDDEDITQKTGFYLMTMEKDTEFNVGLNRNIETVESSFYKKLFLGVKDNTFEFEITLVKAKEIKGDLIAEEIHNEDIENLCRYIIRKEPRAIEKDDKLYYGVFTTANGKFYGNNNGYIIFKFVMSEPYIYSKVIEREFNTNISNKIELLNDTDLIDEKTFIDIEFKYPILNLLDTSNNVVGALNMNGEIILERIEEDGTLTSYLNIRTSDFIDIEGKDKLYSNVSVGYWYDKNKKVISNFTKDYEMTLLEKPKNAKYLRVSFYDYRLENFHMLVNGECPTSYIEYIGTDIPINFINITNNSFIKINKFNNNNYKIYGERKQIINEDNYKDIIYSPNFIYLNYGLNEIKVECEMKITGIIKYQIKYGIK